MGRDVDRHLVRQSVTMRFVVLRFITGSQQALLHSCRQDEEMQQEVSRRWEKYNVDYTKTQAALKAKEGECAELADRLDHLLEAVCSD